MQCVPTGKHCIFLVGCGGTCAPGPPQTAAFCFLVLAAMLSRRSLVMSGSLSAVMAALLPMGEALSRSPRPPRNMPVLFIGHGSPMNAISANPFTQHLQSWGSSLPRPSAILVVSAHARQHGGDGE